MNQQSTLRLTIDNRETTNNKQEKDFESMARLIYKLMPKPSKMAHDPGGPLTEARL